MLSLRLCATAAFLSAALVVAEKTRGQECEFKGSNAGEVRLNMLS